MSMAVAEDPAPTPAGSGRPGWLTALIAIAVLVVGVAAGYGLRAATHDDAPSADAVSVGFAQDMSTHHDQAVQMSSAVLASADPAVRSLAYDMLTSQQNQIGQMQGWLALWDQPATNPGAPMEWMTADAHASHAGHSMGAMSQGTDAPLMPGMATNAEMAQLRTATGPAQDLLFLQLMLRHHEGGLAMMQDGVDHAGQRVVRELAQTMLSTQQSEATLLTQMIGERGGQPLPMN